MSPLPHTAAFHNAVIDRAREDGPGSLSSWARQVGPFGPHFTVAPHAAPECLLTLRPSVVERGLYRIQGGQDMDRPEGVTSVMFADIQRAVENLDVEEMGPRTASAILQVGLFGKVVYS